MVRPEQKAGLVLTLCTHWHPSKEAAQTGYSSFPTSLETGGFKKKKKKQAQDLKGLLDPCIVFLMELVAGASWLV